MATKVIEPDRPIAIRPSENIMPPLPAADREALRASIAEHGVQQPIIVSSGPAAHGKIADGFNRYEIAVELGVPCPMILRPFATAVEFELFSIDANVARRQLTLPQRVELARKREPLERRLAEHRKLAGRALGDNPDGRDLSERSPDKRRSDQLAAEAVGLSRNTYKKAKHVLDAAPDPVREAFKSGNLSVDRAYKETKRAQGLDPRELIRQQLERRLSLPMPTKPADVLVIDAPWRLENGGFEPSRLSFQELVSLPIRSLVAENGVAFLWAPTLWLGDAFALADQWGLSVVSVLPWIKDTAAPGAVLKEKAEFCLLLAAGRPAWKHPGTVHNVLTGGPASRMALFGGDAARSSRLPKTFYTLAEHIVEDAGNGRLALFEEPHRDGWDTYVPEILVGAGSPAKAS